MKFLALKLPPSALASSTITLCCTLICTLKYTLQTHSENTQCGRYRTHVHCFDPIRLRLKQVSL